MNYDWNFSRVFPYCEAFFYGTCVTLEVTAIVILVGTILGIVLGLALGRRLGRVFLYPGVDMIRSLPPIVLILFMYYLLTREVIGITIPAFWVYSISMSLNLAAFTSDLVRAAVENVPSSETDAGRALGLSHAQIVRHIVLPHVIREIVPSMTLLYIGMLKMSSLASVINVREVVYTAQTVISDSSRSLEAWVVVALIYIALVIPATNLARKVEVWIGRSRSSKGAL